MSTPNQKTSKQKNFYVAISFLCCATVILAHPMFASKPEVDTRTEEVVLTIAPGLEVRGWHTTFEVAGIRELAHQGLSTKAENHEVDPDPLLLSPSPGSQVHVLDVYGEDEDGEALPRVRILLLPESALGIAGKAENHEVDPDPLYATPEVFLWQAQVHFPGTARAGNRIGFLVRDDDVRAFLAGPQWLDAFLAWTAVWLWPDAYAGEAMRPHDERFRLLTYGPFEAR